MRKTINSLSILLMFLAINSTCFGQEIKYNSNWEVGMSSGQSFVDYYDGFGTGYNKGLTISPEVNYNFSRFFSLSFSLLLTTAHNGEKDVSFHRTFSVENMENTSIHNHYQTTLTPTIQFTPIKSNRHNMYIGVGPSYTFGNSLFSETVAEASTTMAKKINEFGYLGTLGYKFSVLKNWTIGAKYIYNKNEEKTEHILFCIGFKL
ncbi:hypothetical protein [uncultured Draconibacterium sp.]|uniref:hypothetical protein n=1 Tax=uncultured Draconibacterium sp. TaxID=1573823 RepID=UPI0029C830D4|nr:hypothetical protein [uncultured Draconibacterium sp.]